VFKVEIGRNVVSYHNTHKRVSARALKRKVSLYVVEPIKENARIQSELLDTKFSLGE
jgi:hypothetical protein